MKIIIFEDNEAILQNLARLINSLGHDVQIFNDPTFCPLVADLNCTCTIDRPCADVLITDNFMPNISGLDFIHRQYLKGCKGIVGHKAVMSGLWTDAELEQAEKLGCKIFTKPVDQQELLDWLKKCQLEISSTLPG